MLLFRVKVSLDSSEVIRGEVVKRPLLDAW